MHREALLRWLDDRLQRVEREFTIHAGGKTTCQLHKSAETTDRLKYDEGQLVALHNIRRALQQIEAWHPDTAQTLVEDERARWDRMLNTYRAAARPAPAWLAYSQGGLDALEALLSVLGDGRRDDS
ncbi:MAG: hypothetical protein H3C34_24960 [Caldilineaceae bacterium]|nr:hypothetical protein [Caldilineaceae bacterium]